MSTAPHTTKKQRLDDHQCDAVAADNDFSSSFDDVLELLPNILGYLTPKDVMRQRRVCKKCSEAATKTIVSLTDFDVNSLVEFNAMNVMTTKLPNLQQIRIGYLEEGHKYSDGEDPDEERTAETADRTTHAIEIISNFSKLRILKINAELNGRYPFLFNSFPLLEKMSICYCGYLKWDLEMLAGFPVLKELFCWHNYGLTGNISSLRVLKDTLEKVEISCCDNVEGNFMDLADFPRLKKLDLWVTAVAGDIRDIGDDNFSALESLRLPKRVYGGFGYEFQRISDAPDLIRAVYLFNKQRPAFSMLESWQGELSEDSPEWYEPSDFDVNYVQFSIYSVKAGTRFGYQWQTNGHWCEVNWLDPEPDRDSSEYAKYIEELRRMQRRAKLFKGLNQPPTEEEYNRLLVEYDDERSEGSEE